MSHNRPFDLAKLDFEGIRLRKRKKLLLLSAPLAIIVAVIMLKMLSIPVFSTIGYNNYDKLQYDSAISWLQPLTWFNWMEPYKVHFNQGNASFKSGKYEAAEQKFRQALESVPEDRECDVRINLALSLEQQADAFLSEKKYDEAILKYDDVKAVIYDGQDSCGVQFHNKYVNSDSGGDDEGEGDGDKQESDTQDNNDGSGDNQQDAKNIEKRVREKSSSAKQMRNNDEVSQGDERESSQQELKSTEEKMKQLEQNANRAQQERAKNQQSQRQNDDYERNKGQSNYGKKTW